ncbi:hypothetical protein CDAR_108181 [Caerostris darwini]|uniref:Uncharacterized protein n=1 Tax=Caerostris darwini TaxID=1538125 RepID=A0AAV4X4J7_9ARAC|nr:hypothetical protein CDAR_108181 [Caerostris darwini]
MIMKQSNKVLKIMLPDKNPAINNIIWATCNPATQQSATPNSSTSNLSTPDFDIICISIAEMSECESTNGWPFSAEEEETTPVQRAIGPRWISWLFPIG